MKSDNLPICAVAILIGALLTAMYFGDDRAEKEKLCLANGGVRYEAMAPNGGKYVCWRTDGTRVFLGAA